MTLEGDGNQTVPLKDLMAVKTAKEALEQQIGVVQGQLNELKLTSDSHYQNMLNERASREASETKLKQLQDQATRVQELESSLNAANLRSGEMSQTLLGLKKDLLVRTYSVSPAVLEGKDEAGLKALEEALKLVGTQRASGIDQGGGGGGSTPLTPREKITAGLNALHQK